jgi:hypothetical protein
LIKVLSPPDPEPASGLDAALGGEGHQARLPQRRLIHPGYPAGSEVRVTYGHLSLFW